MTKNKLFFLVLLCFGTIESKCIGQSVIDDNSILNPVQLDKSNQGIKDTMDFSKFRNLFPCSSLSDSNRIVNTGNTIPMKIQYRKYLCNNLILHTGSFLSGIFFFNDNYYVAFFDYMEEHPQGREFHTQILLYSLNGAILKEICVPNGQDNPDFIGEWYVCTSSIKHLYFGPYSNDDSHLVNCKETIYSLSPNSPLTIEEERHYSTIKNFVW